MVFIYAIGSNEGDKYVTIQVNGELVKKISLSQNSQSEMYDFEFNDHIGYIEVKNGAVRMLEMDTDICPQGICSDMGWMDKGYQSIICLPNKIVVNFEEKNGNEIDILSY